MKEKTQDITNNTKLAFTFSEWWKLVLLIIGVSAWLTGFQINTQNKLNELGVNQKVQYIQTIQHLNKIDENMNLYVTKSKLKDSIVFYDQIKDMGETNIVKRERQIRAGIEDVLSR